MIYLSPIEKEHVKRKWLDLEAVLSGQYLKYIYYTKIYV
jgi:hypothetical protein